MAAPNSPTGAAAGRATRTAIVLACLFVAGACGFVCYVVWSRLLVARIGAGAFAASAVLTASMSGLGLGGYLFGKSVDRLRSPLLLCAFLQLATGLCALFVPSLLDRVAHVHQGLCARGELPPYALSLSLFGVAFAVLLAPMCSIGGVLPVLARYFTDRQEHCARRVGLLFALHLLGAAAGGGLATLVLIPALGLHGTLAVAAGVALLLAVVVLAVWVRERRAARAAQRSERHPVRAGDVACDPLPGAGPSDRALALTCFVACGLCGLAYATTWSRVLALAIGPSVYAQAIFVMVLLFGIGLGSLLCSAAASPSRCHGFHLGLVLALGGLSAFGTMLLFAHLPYWFLACFGRLGHRFGWVLVIELALASSVVLLPSVLLGMAFPLAVGVYVSDRERLGAHVGEVCCAGLLGGVVGALAARFLLLPLAGVQPTVLAAVAAEVLLGLALVLRSRECQRVTKVTFAVGLAACAVVWPGALRPWNGLLMSSGVYRDARTLSRVPREQLEARYAGEGDELLHYAEGTQAAVCVTEDRRGDRGLCVNGTVVASSSQTATPALLGHLPLLFRPHARRVLVLGYGAGITAGAVLCHPVEALVCVEVERRVVEAGSFFDLVNRQPLRDTRLRLDIGDARAHLELVRGRQDVIVSRGASHRLTREFFAAAARRLTEDGVFCQWLPIDALAVRDLRALLGTFHDVFPYTYVFVPGGRDAVLIGARAAMAIPVAEWQRLVSRGDVAASLRQTGVRGLPGVLGRCVLGHREVERLVAGGERNTDDNALVEFRAPRAMHTLTCDGNLTWLRDAGVAAVAAYLTDEPPAKTDRAQLMLEVAREAQHNGWPAQALALASASDQLAASAAARRLRGSVYARSGQTEAALRCWHQALALDRHDVETMAAVARLHLEAGQLDAADAVLRKLLTEAPQHMEGRYLKGMVRWKQGEIGEALREFRLAQSQSGASAAIPRVYYMLAQAFDRQGRPQDALPLLEHYVRLVPGDPDARLDLGAMYHALGRRADAVEQWQFGTDVTRGQSRSLLSQARAALRSGEIEQAEQRLREAIDRDRQNLDAYFELGRLLDQQGRVDAGIELLGQLVERYPLNRRGHYLLGLLHQQNGDKTQAASHLREYLRLETNAERRAQVKQQLKELESAR